MHDVYYEILIVGILNGSLKYASDLSVVKSNGLIRQVYPSD